MSSLFFLLILSGCSFFIQKIDSEIVNQKNYLKNIPEKKTFCPLDRSIHQQVINANSKSQEIFEDFTQKNPQYHFIDRLIFWSLIQMSIRPDQSSPSSRLQVLISHNKSPLYLDFFSENDEAQYPFLYGLDWIGKKFKAKNLEFYAKILDNELSQKFKVEKDLEIFLELNKEKLKQDSALAPFFVRGTEVLKEGERIPLLNFTQLIKVYRKNESKQKIIVNTILNQFKTDMNQAGYCNYDFNLYQNSIFLIDQSMPVSNIFGLATIQDTFMASTTQKIDQIQAIDSLPLFYGSSKVRSSAICMVEKDDSFIWAISNLSRDPGQHLFHLIRYGLARSQRIEDVDKLIRHSRYLFLSDPLRLIIESNRSRSDQIENLLKLNVPVYNADKLGNIWSFSKFKNTGRFIIDDRNQGSFSCK